MKLEVSIFLLRRTTKEDFVGCYWERNILFAQAFHLILGNGCRFWLLLPFPAHFGGYQGMYSINSNRASFESFLISWGGPYGSISVDTLLTLRNPLKKFRGKELAIVLLQNR
jgi:hypothetical protein